uniref:Chlororespiratory reduction 4 n=1 Tax=Kalanchoe fedtschenkoi TaxID=63787 RepID=A0A7N0REL4_KALFE
MTIPVRAPTWVSCRRQFEQKLELLHKCSDLNQLKQMQAQIFKRNAHQDLRVAPKLITAFSICRQMASAVNVFNQVERRRRSALLYNSLIRAYVRNGQHSQAFEAFFQMQLDGIWPDNFTYPCLLKACCGLHCVQMIHSSVVKFGFGGDIFVPNALIDSYAKCGVFGISAARKLFDEMSEKDVVSWNTMVGGMVKAGEVENARKLFDEMPERDAVSWNTILDGYAKRGEMGKAFELFEEMPERNVVSWSTMVSGYSKAGDMEMARLLFDTMPVKSLVPWTIIVSGYAEKGLAKDAIEMYDRMEEARMELDDGTVISVLAACAESGLLGLGRRVRSSMERVNYERSTAVSNALVNMYAKCGDLDEAFSVFDRIASKDIISWNAMIGGLAMHGRGEEALQVFSRMKREGFTPDKVTLVGVLCACTHAGFVDRGRSYFDKMLEDYGVAPEVEHYGCMIDLLGRRGRLIEAFELMKGMPMEPNEIIWGTLLGACRAHNAVELADEIRDWLMNSEPLDSGNSSMLSNIYAAAGDWGSVARLRARMKSSNVQNLPGVSWVELDDEVHEFTVLDLSHPDSEWIYLTAGKLYRHVRQFAHAPKLPH